MLWSEYLSTDPSRTYGRVSKYGVQELAPSIDHIGPIAKSAWDIAAVLQAIAGFDKLDSSAEDVSVPNYIEILSAEKRIDGTAANNFKLGIPSEFFFGVQLVGRPFDEMTLLRIAMALLKK